MHQVWHVWPRLYSHTIATFIPGKKKLSEMSCGSEGAKMFIVLWNGSTSLKCQGKANYFFVQIHFQHVNTVQVESGVQGCIAGYCGYTGFTAG